MSVMSGRRARAQKAKKPEPVAKKVKKKAKKKATSTKHSKEGSPDNGTNQRAEI